jgi:hypothetical protein
MQGWPDLAQHLYDAFFQANFTGIVRAGMTDIDKDGAQKPDSSEYAGNYVFVSARIGKYAQNATMLMNDLVCGRQSLQ